MSKPGPKPLPTNVHLLRGNASKKPLGSLLDDVVRPPVEAPECPAHIEGEARVEWERIVPHLLALGLLSQIDRAALTGYCDAWGEYVEATRCIHTLRAHLGTAFREMPESVQGWFAGHVAKTPSGYEQISIPIQHRNKSLEQLRAFLALFGLSPADRSRVTQSDPQLGLPGLDKPQVGGWGAYK